MEKILFEKEQIESNIKNMAKTLNEYVSTLEIVNDNVIIIGILNGCIHFLSDITRNVNFEHKLYFVKTSSYINNVQQKLEIIGELPDVKDNHVIILDDICDTGKTLKKIVEMVMEKEPLSVKTCVLLNKRIDKKEYIADFNVFDIDNYFVYGYGLDYNDYKRNLPDIRIKIKKDME